MAGSPPKTSILQSPGALIRSHCIQETALAQIIKLVEEAQCSKAPIQKLADQVSAIFVPIVIAIAAITFVGWYFVAGSDLTTALINDCCTGDRLPVCAWFGHTDCNHGGDR